VGYLPNEDGERVLGWVELPTIQFGYDYIPDIWYSFELADSRYENQFYEHYRGLIQDLDMDLVMHFVDSSNFWLSAAPIIMTITFNLVLFLIVFALVLGLVTFLYLRQKRREIAIMRAVGRSAKRVLLQLIVTAVLFGVPAIAIGGGAAWHFALREAESTLAMFEEAYAEAVPLTGFELRWQEMFGDRPMFDGREVGINVDFTVEMAMHWLGILMAVVFAVMVFMIFLGGVRILRLPVLVQLQGEVNAPGKVVSSGDSATAAIISVSSLPKGPLSRSAKSRLSSVLRYICRHILRSPVKTALGLAVTLFFVITLGWLQESIDRTSAEIDRIYETTIIRGEILQHPMAISDSYLNDIIRPTTVRRMIDTGYIYSAAFEAGFEEAFILPQHNGTLPRHWRILSGFNSANLTARTRNPRAPFDYLLGVNDIDMFMQSHTIAAAGRPIDDEGDFDVHHGEVRGGGLRNFDIEFAPGFCADIFSMTVYTPGEVVPVIVSPFTLERRGLSIGEEAVIGYRHAARTFNHFYVVIAGVHNQQIHRDNLQNAVLLPLPVMEHHIRFLHYIAFDFAIDPAYNREINRIREEFELILNPGLVWDEATGFPTLNLFVYDREFNSIISSLGQSMLLLELLYPVAVGLALIIGAGIALLLTLQGTKNAAIMRVLGASRLKTCLVAWAEQLLLCLLGLSVGVGALIVMGRGIDTVFVLSGMYMAGVAFGSLVGAVVITVKAPIEHLQVRE